MNEGISEALLKKYLEGTCNPEEAQIVEDWYLSYGKELSAEEMRSLMRNEELRLRMLRNIKTKAGFSQQQEETPLLVKRQLVSVQSYRTWLSVAAALMFLFVALIVFKAELFDVLGLDSSSVVLVNKNKTIAKYTLPDKSVVWLNPGASLRYAAHFSEHARELEMKGEIFFEVAKDEDRPFVIHSNELTTKVLGTSFRIRVDPNHQEEVSVVSGMVAVSKQKQKNLLVKALTSDQSKDEQPVLLVADQKVSLSKTHKALVKAKETENSSVKMWQRKSISFDDTSLRAIVDTLNRTFNVAISFKNPALNNYTLTADFSQMNLISIMEIMSHSLNIQYEVSGDRIWLVKN